MATTHTAPLASSAHPSDDAGSVQEDPPDPTRPAHRAVPAAIERRYLRIDDRYFFPDRSLAFIDEGSRITVRTHNQEVLHSVIAIAQARGWRVVALSGTEEFRRGMWREAALQGIDARGYVPTDLEMQQVQRALAHARGMAPRQGNEHGRESEHDDDHGSEGASARVDGVSTRDRRPSPDTRSSIKGVLLSAAAAPYRFDPAQRMSYYATIQTQTGERTVWGTDLERALAESVSQPRMGDAIVLSQRGTQPVTVRVPARNADGDLVGDRKIMAQRATWSAETQEYLETLARKAALVRSGALVSGAILSQYPDLTAAAAGLRLASQYVRRVTSDAGSQEQLLQVIRDRMAEAVEQGRRIRLPLRRAPTPARSSALAPSFSSSSSLPIPQRGRSVRNRDDPVHEKI